MEASKIRADLAPLAAAHFHFARWERVKHRAHTFALISFPESHPFRTALDALCGDLDTVRLELELCLSRFTQKHGPFSAMMNGFWFPKAEETLFRKDPERYYDCPTYEFGRGIKRRKIMPLAGVGAIHELEPTGWSLLIAASTLAEARAPEARKRIDSTVRAFAHDCKRVLKQLNRITVDPQHKIDVLLCLQRAGLPSESAVLVLAFLV